MILITCLKTTLCCIYETCNKTGTPRGARAYVADKWLAGRLEKLEGGRKSLNIDDISIMF